MRVIGGEHRGRRLLAPRGAATRPTPDRVREALFDILAGRVVEARFLDAYAGTGAVGIEALSRGAARAVFVETDRAALVALRRNLEALALEARARIVPFPLARGAGLLEREEEPFDIVFLDPPYEAGEVHRALRWMAPGRLLAAGGMVVAQHDRALELPAREGGLCRGRSARYGRTCLTFYGPG